jgi:hypothetical protein
MSEAKIANPAKLERDAQQTITIFLSSGALKKKYGMTDIN